MVPIFKRAVMNGADIPPSKGCSGNNKYYIKSTSTVFNINVLEIRTKEIDSSKS